MRQYRDVIAGSVFGRMNLDHFIFHDVKELDYCFKIKGIEDDQEPENDVRSQSREDLFKVTAKSTYLTELGSGWSDLPTLEEHDLHLIRQRRS
jgi:endopolyphosphatase